MRMLGSSPLCVTAEGDQKDYYPTHIISKQENYVLPLGSGFAPRAQHLITLDTISFSVMGNLSNKIK